MYESFVSPCNERRFRTTRYSEKIITYQGVLIDTTGIPVCDCVWTGDLTLYTNATAGSGIWTERHTVTTSGGVFGVILGEKTPLNISFDQHLWMGTSINSRAEIAPRVFLTAVPYALNALNAKSAEIASSVTREVADSIRKSINNPSNNMGDVLIGVINNTGTTAINAARIQGTASRAGSDITVSGPLNALNLKIDDNTVGAAQLQEMHNGPLGPFGSSNSSTVLRVDEQGRVTFAEQVPIIGVPLGGAGGGELTGFYPAPTIKNGVITTEKIARAAVTTTELADNSVTTSKIVDYNVTTQKLVPTGVIPGQYGSTTHSAVIAVDSSGRVLTAYQIPIAPTAQSGPAGDALAGTYPNPTLANNSVSSANIVDGSITQTVSAMEGSLELACHVQTTACGFRYALGIRSFLFHSNHFQPIESLFQGRARLMPYFSTIST